jgi:sec-independent protein translocase protein TatB
MSFSETIFLFFLALIVFGPKKLPEIARQAGRLLAELRRASNEFKSQIESEIAHLEVQKTQAALPSAPPPGAVASLSMNPAASEPVKQEEATLAAPPVAATPVSDSAAVETPAASESATVIVPALDSSSSADSPPLSSTVAEPVSTADPEIATASQDSHV